VTLCYDCADPDERAEGMAAAIGAVRRGEAVVLPADASYGVGVDAFQPAAAHALMAIKGRGRDVPVPVLVGSWRALDGLALVVPPMVRELVEAFWPGGLTLVVAHAPSLAWDLGDTGGTVAVRMPLHPVALELLAEIGPMAVSSANRSGQPPATDIGQARDQLGYAVAVYLDGGPCLDPVPSTIVEVTGPVPRVLRSGAVTLDQLREVNPAVEPAGPGAPGSPKATGE
jgi:tRNA threonylcarbamoyl adenosine modification protein (Sua5/YciO/YrdC/YwlC family)